MPDAPQISALVRTAIMVRDLQRSSDFYRDVLGLTERRFKGTIEDARAAALLGIDPGTHLHAEILKAEGPPFGMIGLFQVDPLPDSPPPPRGGTKVGETCLVFYAPDLKEISDRLVAGGHEIVSPATEISVHAGHSSREMVFRDPDGVLINCIERDPEAIWEGYPVPEL